MAWNNSLRPPIIRSIINLGVMRLTRPGQPSVSSMKCGMWADMGWCGYVGWWSSVAGRAIACCGAPYLRNSFILTLPGRGAATVKILILILFRSLFRRDTLCIMTRSYTYWCPWLWPELYSFCESSINHEAKWTMVSRGCSYLYWTTICVWRKWATQIRTLPSRGWTRYRTPKYNDKWYRSRIFFHL